MNQYPGAIHPQGFNYENDFRIDPFPIFTYQIEDLRLTKSVFMVQGHNTTVVQYEITGDTQSQLRLEVRPLMAFRPYHSTTHENSALDSKIETEPGQITFKPYIDLPALHLAHDPADVDATGFWYRNFQYVVEQERGLNFSEDLFNPCKVTFDLNSRTKISIVTSTEQLDAFNADDYRKAEVARRSTGKNELVTLLKTAADQFIVSRDCGETVIGGSVAELLRAIGEDIEQPQTEAARALRRASLRQR
jgi:predicted glycogen debranching enzyme